MAKHMHRAIEALEARALPPDSIATELNSLQNTLTVSLCAQLWTQQLQKSLCDPRPSAVRHKSQVYMLPLGNPVPQLDVSFPEKAPEDRCY